MAQWWVAPDSNLWVDAINGETWVLRFLREAADLGQCWDLRLVGPQGVTFDVSWFYERQWLGGNAQVIPGTVHTALRSALIDAAP